MIDKEKVTVRVLDPSMGRLLRMVLRQRRRAKSEIGEMSLFGHKPLDLPTDLVSEHFSNNELQQLYRVFCLGNSLPEPTQITIFAEMVYKYNSLDALTVENRQMIKDGLGAVFALAFDMKKRKEQNPDR